MLVHRADYELSLLFTRRSSRVCVIAEPRVWEISGVRANGARARATRSCGILFAALNRGGPNSLRTRAPPTRECRLREEKMGGKKKRKGKRTIVDVSLLCRAAPSSFFFFLPPVADSFCRRGSNGALHCSAGTRSRTTTAGDDCGPRQQRWRATKVVRKFRTASRRRICPKPRVFLPTAELRRRTSRLPLPLWNWPLLCSFTRRRW